MDVIKYSSLKKQLKIGKKTYIGFKIGNLPRRFAFIYSEGRQSEGTNNWINFKGYTFVEKE
jgi:hypothetical protein